MRSAPAAGVVATRYMTRAQRPIDDERAAPPVDELQLEALGETWGVPRIDEVHDLAAARPYWRWLLGCKRCRRICTDTNPCPCTEMTKAARPYNLEGNFVRLMLVSEFVQRFPRTRSGTARRRAG